MTLLVVLGGDRSGWVVQAKASHSHVWIIDVGRGFCSCDYGPTTCSLLSTRLGLCITANTSRQPHKCKRSFARTCGSATRHGACALAATCHWHPRRC
eukprot:scaffold755_cov122-Isochrysis_galbana.AAC.2